jgi:hypothetical protein
MPALSTHGSLQGISIHNMDVIPGVSMLAWWVSYYSDGFVNISTSSLNLAQP